MILQNLYCSTSQALSVEGKKQNCRFKILRLAWKQFSSPTKPQTVYAPQMSSICHSRDIVYRIFSASPWQINCPHITSSSVFFVMLSFSASINLLSAHPAWQIHPQHPSIHIVIITAQNMSTPSRSGLPLKHLIGCSSDALSLDPIHQHRSQKEAIISFCHLQLGLLIFSRRHCL